MCRSTTPWPPASCADVSSGRRRALPGVTPYELCIVHAGPLPASVWSRLRAHLPIGTTLRLLDLEAHIDYWQAGPTGAPREVTVGGVARPPRPEPGPPAPRRLAR